MRGSLSYSLCLYLSVCLPFFCHSGE